MPFRIAARWIYPVSSPPLAWGCVTIEQGKIIALSDTPDQADVRLDNFALIPGLVNAHTHLDLSDSAQIIPSTEQTPASLPQWLLQVIAHRRQTTLPQAQRAIQLGLEESLRFGVTGLCDVSVGGGSYDLLCQAPIRSLVCYEILGLNPQRLDETWQRCSEWSQLGTTGMTQRGISPHAPYSTHRDLLMRSASTGLPLTIHLAESLDEQTLLQSHRGEFVEFLQTLNVWFPEGLCHSLEEVLRILEKAPRVLLAHGNYLQAPPPTSSGMSIVYCPRTHALFRHHRYPLKEYIDQGWNIALGTDSRASNPDLDLFAEMQWLARNYPEIDPQTILQMGTLNGAKALGWDHVCGSIEIGKAADLVALSIPSTVNDSTAVNDPNFLLLHEGVGDSRYTLFNGTWRGENPRDNTWIKT